MDSEFFYMDGVGGRGSCGADGLFGGSYLTRAGGGWEASLPWATLSGEVWGGTRGGKDASVVYTTL